MTPDILPPGDDTFVGSGGGAGKSTGFPGKGGSGFDDSPVVTAARQPPPISGGTLLALRSGARAVVADSDRDRILVVDLGKKGILAQLDFDTGSEPGRVIEDDTGRVHGLLRGSGELVTIDVDAGRVTARRSVCRAPRGLAYDATHDSVLVACLEGTLVELPAAGGAATRVTEVATDLRDVVFLGQQLVLTRFRSAQLLYLDDERRIQKTVPLASDGPSFMGFSPTVAWRAIATPDGKLAIAHQRSFSGRIAVNGDGPDPGDAPGTPLIDVGLGSAGASGAPDLGSAGAPPGTTINVPDHGGYGSSFDPCGSVVQGTVTLADAGGNLVSSPNLAGAVLPVDLAVASDRVAVVFAGADASVFDNVAVYDPNSLHSSVACLTEPWGVSAPGAVSVALAPGNLLLVQVREPAALQMVDLTNGTLDQIIELGGESVFDTGHEVFHHDAGAGIACASCHPEGTEDGHVWQFSDVGGRRTQPLDVGLFGTAPFHWDGELSTFGDLMSNVFVQRMGGPSESGPRIAAVESFVYDLPRRPAVRAADDPAAVRGKALFESKEAECSTCHRGALLSDGRSYDIGKGVPVQVPSLIAVSARAPYMHDGCARTLTERFDPKCGGSAHGDVSHLDDADIADLVAYLETL